MIIHTVHMLPTAIFSVCERVDCVSVMLFFFGFFCFILDEFLINENQNMWLKRYVYVKVQEFEGFG